MYNDIVSIYDEIFPLNQGFMAFIQRYLGKAGLRVLDLGCGPGGYVDVLSRLGYEAVGIDSSEGMIKAALAHYHGDFYPLSFSEINQLKGPFTTIFSIGNSLSYLEPDAMVPFFEDTAALMSDNGTFVMQVVNWDKFRLEGASDFPVKNLSSGRTFHRCYEVMNEQMVMFHTELRQGVEILGSWSNPLYPKYIDDLKKGLKAAGMVIVNLFGDFEGVRYDPTASPATVLIVKKAVHIAH
jgi:SAM-dependent methyltransferase